jgi:hypothetical protein
MADRQANHHPNEETKIVTTTNTNGRVPRKTLASQIDRLDTILDDLATGLNEAVTTAVAGAVRGVVGEAVTQAVQVAVREVLTNAELLNRLTPKPVAIPARQNVASKLWHGLMSAAGSCWRRASALVSRGRSKFSQSLTQLSQDARELARNVKRGMTNFGRRVFLGGVVLLALVSRFRKPLAMALGVGVSLGLGSYLAGPLVSSLTSGLAGFVGSLVGCALSRLRQLASSFELSDG